MVFQQFNLFPHLTVIENITLAPRRVLGMAPAEAESLAMDLLRRVGRIEDARASYARALELVTQAAERRFLERRLEELASLRLP